MKIEIVNVVDFKLFMGVKFILGEKYCFKCLFYFEIFFCYCYFLKSDKWFLDDGEFWFVDVLVFL